MTDDWSDEETNDPQVADSRNFYKVEKWTRDAVKVDKERVLNALSLAQFTAHLEARKGRRKASPMRRSRPRKRIAEAELVRCNLLKASLETITAIANSMFSCVES
jgi:hypothetical protein